MRYSTRIVKVPPRHAEPLSLPGCRIAAVLHSALAGGMLQLTVLIEEEDTA